MSEYQYNVDEGDLLDLQSPLMDLYQKAINAQYQEVESRLKELLPDHLRDGHDLSAAQAWFQEHEFTISSRMNDWDSTRTVTRTITIHYPSYLDK